MNQSTHGMDHSEHSESGHSGMDMAEHAHQQPESGLAAAGNFLRHLGEMILAMIVGMAAGVAVLALIFLTVLGSAINGMTRGEVLLAYPALICLVMAIGMIVPMVIWMRHRGHDWRSTSEMAAAMAIPLIPILALLGLRAIPGDSACGLYCVAMIPAMVIAMLVRLDLYTMSHAAHIRHMGHAT